MRSRSSMRITLLRSNVYQRPGMGFIRLRNLPRRRATAFYVSQIARNSGREYSYNGIGRWLGAYPAYARAFVMGLPGRSWRAFWCKGNLLGAKSQVACTRAHPGAKSGY